MAQILRTIAKNVYHYRLKKGLTQKELAEKIKVHPSYISHVENARINIYLTTLVNLARALGVGPRDLVK